MDYTVESISLSSPAENTPELQKVARTGKTQFFPASRLTSLKFIATDPVAMLAVQSAINDMGRDYVSAMLLDGPPGCGKSYLGKYLASKLKADLLAFQFFPGAGVEELFVGVDYGLGGTRTLGVLLMAMQASRERKVVLLLDELDKAQASVDAFLLNILNDGCLFLPQTGLIEANTKNLLVVLSKNDERQATGPLLRRCRCIFMQWPTLEVETRILQAEHPNLDDVTCAKILEVPHFLRRHADVRKKPSTPEIVRLCGDLLNFVTARVAPLELGLYYLNGVAPLEADRPHISHSAIYLGKMIEDSFKQCLARSVSRG